MKFIVSNQYDPCYNLALEEYILHHLRDDTYCLLWQNEQTLVVGKFQNVFEEINIPAAYQQNIKIMRRNSGGGTVFHDKGNVNISFIKDWNPEVNDTNDEFLDEIIHLIGGLKIILNKANTSDLRVGEYKVSGNAQTIYKGRLLHHGTLLFDSNLENLNEVLKPSMAQFQSKAIKSNRSKVGNLKNHMAESDISVETFKKQLEELLRLKGAKQYTLDEKQIAEVLRIKADKYDTWEWNIGKSPDFTFSKREEAQGHFFSVRLEVKKGIITTCQLDGDLTTPDKLQQISALMVNHRYDYPEIMALLTTLQDFNKEEIDLMKKSFF